MQSRRWSTIDRTAQVFPWRWRWFRIYGILSENNLKPYDTHEVLDRILDNSEFTEYKKDFGKTILCGYGRIDGWAVGIVANQRAIIKNKKLNLY